MAGSLVAGAYEKTVDRESAFEKLKGRAEQAPSPTSSGGGGATDKATGSWAASTTSCSAPPGRAAAATKAWWRDGQVGRAHHGQHRRPRDHPRRAGQWLPSTASRKTAKP
jgi:hypothetical protein